MVKKSEKPMAETQREISNLKIHSQKSPSNSSEAQGSQDGQEGDPSKTSNSDRRTVRSRSFSVLSSRDSILGSMLNSNPDDLLVPLPELNIRCKLEKSANDEEGTLPKKEGLDFENSD